MATEINMIRVGLTMKVGSITRWVKKVGEPVKKGETVAEMETEKLTYDIPSPADGVLLKIVTKEYEEVPIGHLLGYIGEPGEKLPDDAAVSSEKDASPVSVSEELKSTKPTKGVRISPAARKLAEAKGVNYVTLVGSGPGGRITIEDVENAAISSEVEAENKACNDGQPTDVEYEIFPYTGMRKAVGENMFKSWTVAPRVTHHGRVDVTELQALRKRLNEGAEKADRISVTDMIIAIAAKMLKKHPNINASLTDEGIRRYRTVNVGMAVALTEGLIVPVIKNAADKTLREISAETKTLSKKVKERSLAPEEFSGGTFTVTNLGMYKSVEFFSPIINQPESAILGVCKTIEMPVVKDGKIAVAPMMGYSLTFDHRVIDGAVAAEFLDDLIDSIENPQKALLN